MFILSTRLSNSSSFFTEINNQPINVGVLGTGVPRLVCLWPTAWLSRQAVRPIFTNKASKTLARGQASRGR